jgi:hypothetical protein
VPLLPSCAAGPRKTCAAHAAYKAPVSPQPRFAPHHHPPPIICPTCRSPALTVRMPLDYCRSARCLLLRTRSRRAVHGAVVAAVAQRRALASQPCA